RRRRSRGPEILGGGKSGRGIAESSRLSRRPRSFSDSSGEGGAEEGVLALSIGASGSFGASPRRVGGWFFPAPTSAKRSSQVAVRHRRGKMQTDCGGDVAAGEWSHALPESDPGGLVRPADLPAAARVPPIRLQ